MYATPSHNRYYLKLIQLESNEENLTKIGNLFKSRISTHLLSNNILNKISYDELQTDQVKKFRKLIKDVKILPIKTNLLNFFKFNELITNKNSNYSGILFISFLRNTPNQRIAFAQTSIYLKNKNNIIKKIGTFRSDNINKSELIRLINHQLDMI